MFKQLTNFDNFNVFVGGEKDLEYKEETSMFLKGNNIIVEYLLDDVTSEMVADVIDRSFKNVLNKNIYIVTKGQQVFLDYWIINLIAYLK